MQMNILHKLLAYSRKCLLITCFTVIVMIFIVVVPVMYIIGKLTFALLMVEWNHPFSTKQVELFRN